MAWLVEVQQEARRVGFVVPHFVKSGRGTLVENGLTLEEWVDGVSASRAQRCEALPLVQAFHAATREHRQRPGFVSSVELLRVDRGGDVDLTCMPEDLVSACREAWSRLASEPVSAVHGDLSEGNLLVTGAGDFALIDWDEARVDASVLDEIALGGFNDAGVAAPFPRSEVLAALEAWEVAASWVIEPVYARRAAGRLLRRLEG